MNSQSGTLDLSDPAKENVPMIPISQNEMDPKQLAEQQSQQQQQQPEVVKPAPLLKDASRHSLALDVDKLWEEADAQEGTLTVEDEANMLTKLMFKKYVGNASIDEDAEAGSTALQSTKSEDEEDAAAKERRETAADLHRSLELLNKRMDEQLKGFESRARRGSFTGTSDRDSNESGVPLTPREKREAKRRRNKTLDNPLDTDSLDVIRTPSPRQNQSNSNTNMPDFEATENDRQGMVTTLLSKIETPQTSKSDDDVPELRSSRTSKVTTFAYDASQPCNDTTKNSATSNPTTPSRNQRWGNAPRTTSFGYVSMDKDNNIPDDVSYSNEPKFSENSRSRQTAQPTNRRRARSSSPRRKKLPHRPISRVEARDAMQSVMKDSSTRKQPPTPIAEHSATSTPVRHSLPGVIESPDKSPIKPPATPLRQTNLEKKTSTESAPSEMLSPSNGWVNETAVLETPKRLPVPVEPLSKGPLRGGIIHMQTHNLPASSPLASAALNESVISQNKSFIKTKIRKWRRGKEKLKKNMIGLPNEFVHLSHTAPEDVGQLMSSLQTSDILQQSTA